jgi:hypothetical protein
LCPGTCSAGAATCTVTAGSFTLNTATNIPPGGVGFVRFQAQVSPTAAPGTPVSNTVTGTVTPGTFTQVNTGLATASLTVVGVTPPPVVVPPPVVTPGPFLVCGTVTTLVTTGVTPTMTIGGVVVPIATGATINVMSGVTFAVNVPVCVQVTFVSGVASVIQVVPFATGIPVVCGTYTLTSTTGYILVGGVLVPVAAGSTFTAGLPTGFTKCFLLNNGFAYAVLSGIPTSIKSLKPHRHFFREGFARAE